MGNWKPDGAGSNFCVSRNLTIDSGSREGTLLYMVTGEKNIPNRFSVTLNIQVQSSNKKEDKENLIKSVEVLTKKILNTSTPQKILNSIKSGKDVEIKVKDMNLKVETTKYTGGSYLYCKGYQVRVIIEKHK